MSVPNPPSLGATGSPDRRPIAARRLPVFAAMAAALARARFSPNLISILGMFAAALAGVLLALSGAGVAGVTQRLVLAVAAALIQLRLLANMLDGMVAVEGNMRSPTGDLYNEAPDRVSDVAVLIGAGYAATGSPTFGFLSAIGAVLVAYARALGKGSGHPADFRGPMAKQQRMFIVTVASLYLAIAPAGSPWRPVLTLSDHAPFDQPLGVMSIALAIIIIGCAITFCRRVRLLSIRLRAGGGSGAGGAP